MKEIKAAIIGTVVICIVLAFRWMGQNSAAISAGISETFKVMIVMIVLAGIGGGAWWRWQHRSQPAQQAPPPVHMTAERVPVELPAQDTPALPPGSGDTHLHFHGLSPAEAAEAIRRAGEGR